MERRGGFLQSIAGLVGMGAAPKEERKVIQPPKQSTLCPGLPWSGPAFFPVYCSSTPSIIHPYFPPEELLHPEKDEDYQPSRRMLPYCDI